VERYSSYSFSTSALDGGEWSASCPGRALAPGKGPPVPIGQEAGRAPEPVWTQRLEEKSSCLCRIYVNPTLHTMLGTVVGPRRTRQTDHVERMGYGEMNTES
jgi:hypothetical protein